MRPAAPGARAVVIGGGLLGLEAAAALRLRGMDVVVLHLMGHLMERQLDPAAGQLLAARPRKPAALLSTAGRRPRPSSATSASKPWRSMTAPSIPPTSW